MAEEGFSSPSDQEFFLHNGTVDALKSYKKEDYIQKQNAMMKQMLDQLKTLYTVTKAADAFSDKLKGNNHA